MSKSNELKGFLKQGSSSFIPDLQIQLLNAIQQKNIDAFKELLLSKEVNPAHCYENLNGQTCLDIACSDHGYSEFVKLLLKQPKVDVNKVNDTSVKNYPIHLAVEAGDLNTIRALLSDSKIDVNVMNTGNTVIHLAIKLIGKNKENMKYISQYEKIIETLLECNADVNIPDYKKNTPISSAARYGLKKIVELIINSSKKPVDLDFYIDCNGKSARTIIEETFPDLLPKLPRFCQDHKNISDVHKLFSHLSGHDEDSFIRDFNKIKIDGKYPDILCKDNGMTMLQKICDIGMVEAARTLLKNKADPNFTAPCNGKRPIVLACSNGHHEVLKILLMHEKIICTRVNDESLIQIVVKKAQHLEEEPKRNYEMCLEILLGHEKIKRDINYLDSKNYTALHHAAKSGNQDAVLILLKNGACIAIRNKNNESPLADISAKTLEAYLDYCLTTNNERPNDDNYELQFDYSFLAPPRNTINDKTAKPLLHRFLAPVTPETDALLCMTQYSELIPLLRHPVITSFLYLKWQHIRPLFCINITFYAAFCASLILYILLGYGEPAEKSYPNLTLATKILSIIGLVLLIIREFLQIVVSPKEYIKSVENWLEIILIFITAAIVFTYSMDEDLKQPLSAIAILLSATELVLLSGQFPFWSTYVVMLKTVSWNFFKFLLWYCVLIIAFALSFYTLFRTVKTDDKNLFPNPSSSVFKTIVMLTGEFDAGSITFDAAPVTSRSIFVFFVFMIPIILLNLLNGLAISDTQAIKANAELVGIILRIKLISYFESAILGNWSRMKNVLSSPQNVSCILSRMNCIKSLPMAKACVKINKAYLVEVYNENVDDAENRHMALGRLMQCNQKKMDREIVNAAKKLIAEKEEGGSDMNQLQNKLRSLERSHERIEKLLKEFKDSMNEKTKNVPTTQPSHSGI